VYVVCAGWYSSDNLNSRAANDSEMRLPRRASTANDQLEQGEMDEVATAEYKKLKAELEARSAAMQDAAEARGE
jgi:hypothetical protein